MSTRDNYLKIIRNFVFSFNMMGAMLSVSFTKNKKNKHFIKNFNKKTKNYIHNRHIICIMKIVETWRLFFQFCFLASGGTGGAIRGGSTI